MASMPWGAQAQNRKGARSTTPGLAHSERDSPATTTIACSNSTSSLDKQDAQDAAPLSQRLQRSETSSTLEIPGPNRNGLATTSSDSLDLYDSPLITPMNFPTPPEKPSYILAQYQSSQVTPPPLQPATPQPVEPRTPTLASPDTGRFEATHRSYPSPVQAGFRSPSSRYSAESSGRRDVSGTSFKAARALSFDIQDTPVSSIQSPRDRLRTDSFGAPETAEWHTSRSTPTRMPDITETAHGSHSRYINYGFDVLESPLNDVAESGRGESAKEGRVLYGLGNTEPRRAFQLEPSNDTPNISISELVSSPPSVDTGVDYNTIYTSVVTPEDRNFPNIGLPSSTAENWTSPGLIGLGEGIAGGPQRDERGKKVDSRRWRLADPMLLGKPRTAVDVYTNDNSGKQRTGFKDRFSQSMLNLIGETKKSKRQQGHGNLGAETSQWPRKMTKKEKVKSVTDLLGPSVPRTTYEWNQPKAAEPETAGAKARAFMFKRSESTPAQLSSLTDARVRDSGPSASSNTTFLKRSRRFPSQQTRNEARAFPASPSMPALSATLHERSSPDLRIQSWLNASQAALLETQAGRYDLGRIGLQDQLRVHPTPLKPYSFSSTNLSRALNSTADEEAKARESPLMHKSAASGLQAIPPVLEPPAALPVVIPTSGPNPAGKQAKRRSILSLGVAVNNVQTLPQLEKPEKKRTSSISKLTSWLGLRRSSSKKASDLRVEAGKKSVISPVAYQAPPRTATPAELGGPTRKTASFANLHSMLTPSTAEEQAQKKHRRRSGGDWFGSVGRRRADNGSPSIAQREPHIVLLSAEHLPPPTINEQGFLQSSAPALSATRSTITPSASQWSFAQSQDSIEQFPVPEPAFTAPRMERDLSRLTEGEEEETSRQERTTLPVVATSKSVPIIQSYRKPPPVAFPEPLATSPNSLSVPSFEVNRRHSGKLDRRLQGLSIGSLSSLSTGITDGEEHRATIRTVLASPIHNDMPSGAALVVARGVSMDLNALTPEECQAVGFGTITGRAVAT